MYGVTIATGDTDGDGENEIIVGPGPDPRNKTVVRLYSTDGLLKAELRPYGPAHTFGLWVGSADIDGDGQDEVVTGLGPSPLNPSRLRVMKQDGAILADFLAFPSQVRFGARVSVGKMRK